MNPLREKIVEAIKRAEDWRRGACLASLRQALDMIDRGDVDLATDAPGACANCGESLARGGCSGIFSNDGDACLLNNQPS